MTTQRKKTIVRVRSSVTVNPPEDFNEWANHVYTEVKRNYKNKISCTK